MTTTETDKIVCPFCQVRVVEDPKPGKECKCGGVLPKPPVGKPSVQIQGK